jgi:hypothetical protein
MARGPEAVRVRMRLRTLAMTILTGMIMTTNEGKAAPLDQFR